MLLSPKGEWKGTLYHWCVMSDDHLDKDTIAAVATPIGQAGIGIVRMSGPHARQIAEKIFKPKRPVKRLRAHRLYLGYLIDPLSER